MKRIIASIVGMMLLATTGVAFAAPTIEYHPSMSPVTTNTYDLGSALKQWLTGYFGTICLSGDCKSAWPTGGGGTDGNWVYFNGSGIKLATTSNQVLIGRTSTTTNSAAEINGTTTATVFNATSTTASSSFANGINLTKGCFSILGTCITGGSSASSTLLADNNTFTGLNIFSNALSTFAGIAAKATILATPRAINGVNFDGSAPITIQAASSTLLTDQNTLTASTSINKLTTISATTTNATTTGSQYAASLTIGSLTGVLKASAGAVSAAILGTDYVNGSGVSGNCVKWGASNSLSDQGAPCGSGGSASAAGSQTQIQYNGGSNTFAATNTFTFATTSTNNNLIVQDPTGSGFAYTSLLSSYSGGLGTSQSLVQGWNGSVLPSVLTQANGSGWGITGNNGSADQMSLGAGTALGNDFINDSRNFAIGTTTAQAKLTLQGAYGNQNDLLAIATTTNSSGSATSTALAVQASGNVVIGTTTAQKRLTVNLASLTYGNRTVQSSADGIALIGNSATYILRDTGSSNQEMSWNFNGGVGEFGTVNAGNFAIKTNATQRLTVRSDGRVGISSTTPGVDLAIGNNATQYIALATTSTSTFSKAIYAPCFSTDNINCLTSSGGSGASTTILTDANTFTGSTSINTLTTIRSTSTQSTSTNFFSSILTATSGFFTNLFVTGSSTLQDVTMRNATTTNATTTSLAATTICLIGDTCRTTWPTGSGSAYPFYALSTAQATNTLMAFTQGATGSYFTSTSTATSSFVNYNGEFWATSTSVDIGKQVMNYYNNYCWGDICIVNIPKGSYTQNVATFPMNFNTAGKRISLRCAEGDGTIINLTGAGTSTRINAGNGGTLALLKTYDAIVGCTFSGDLTTGQVGIEIGGSNGAQGAMVRKTSVFTTDKGISFSANTNAGASLIDSNSQYNNKNLAGEMSGDGGEGIEIINSNLSDCQSGHTLKCVDFSTTQGSSVHINHSEIDDAELYIEDGNLNVTVENTHLENPDTALTGQYNFIRVGTGGYGALTLIGNTFWNGGVSSVLSPYSFIYAGNPVRMFGNSFGSNGARIGSVIQTYGNGRVEASGNFYPLNTVAANNIPVFSTSTAVDFMVDPVGHGVGIGTSTGNSGLSVVGNVYVSGSTTLQNFTGLKATTTAATTTNLFSSIASSTNLFTTNFYAGGLNTCNAANQALTYTNGLFGCNSAITGASTTLLANNNTFSGANSFATMLVTGSTTLQNFTGLRSTTTEATTTSLFATNAVATNLRVTNAPIFTALTGILKGNGASALTVASNGTDYTLITANTCGAGQFFNQTTAAGVFTCGTPSGGGGASSTLLVDANTFTGNNLFSLLTATRATTTYATTTYLNVSGNATTTFANGIELTGGCFKAAGACISAGAGGSSVGGTGAVQYANGSAFDGDNTKFSFDSTNKRLVIGTTTAFAQLAVQGVYGSQFNLIDIATTTNSSGSATSSLFNLTASGMTTVRHTEDGTGQTAFRVISNTTGLVGLFNNTVGDATLNVRSDAGYGAAYLNLYSTAAEYLGVAGYVGDVLKWKIGRNGNSDGIYFNVVDGLTTTLQLKDNLVAYFTGKVGIGDETPLHTLDVKGRISGQPSYDCMRLWQSQTNLVTDQLGSATVASPVCEGNMFHDFQGGTGAAGILALTTANSETGLASGTPALQIMDASIALPAANNLTFVKDAIVGSATSSLGDGIAIEAVLRTPKVGTATTSVEHVFGFSDVSLASVATIAAYATPSNGCALRASSTPNWMLVCYKAGVQTIADTGRATSTTAFKVLLVLDRTGANVYFNDSDTSSATIASANLPVTWLRPTVGVGTVLGTAVARAQMGVGLLKVWGQDKY